MIKKIFSILLATSILVGGGATKAYASSVDDLYKSAYDCTTKAVQNRDQGSINEARKAIGRLPKDLHWAIGEFSKKVDRPQQELFEKFMSILFDSKGKKKNFAAVNQEQINVARDLVLSFATYDGNKPYISSWSSALDQFQQYRIEQAVNYVEYAEKVKKQECKETAMNSINRLLGAKNNETVVQFAKGLESRVKAIVVTNPDTNRPVKPSDPNTGDRPELDKTDGKNHYTDPTSYNQHVRFSSIDGNPYFEMIYNNVYGRWERYNVGFEDTAFGNERNFAYINYFSGNNQTDFRNWGPCVASFIKVTNLKDSSKSYAELIRLADGFVLERIDPKGNIQVFNAPQVSQKSLNDFNTMNYDDLMNKWLK